MFFKKKKEVLLRHGLLAEALMSLTVKDWHDFKKIAEQYEDKLFGNQLDIRMDEHIRFEVRRFCLDEYSYSFHVDTYIDDIRVNSYFFTLDSKNYGSNFWQEWKLFSKDIYHPLPDSIITQINEFSATHVNKKHQQLNAKKQKAEARKKSIWQTEEDELKEVFKNYEQK